MPLILRNLPLPFSVCLMCRCQLILLELPWRRRKKDTKKRWYLYTIPHGVIPREWTQQYVDNVPAVSALLQGENLLIATGSGQIPYGRPVNGLVPALLLIVEEKVLCVFFFFNLLNFNTGCSAGAEIAQSVQRLATGWTVRGSNPGGGEIFRTCPDRPRGPPSLLYNENRVFPGG